MKNNIYSKSKWIWAKNSLDIDDYAQFIDEFSSNSKEIIIRISCDTVYALYINDNLIKFMMCSDFISDKFYDEIKYKPTTPYNKIRIDVWHYGKDFHTAINNQHGVIYEVCDDDNVICYSNRNTLSRVMIEYKNGYQKILTKQQGFSFYFDNTVSINTFDNSIETNYQCKYTKRDIKDIQLLERGSVTYTKLEDGSILVDLLKETCGLVDLEFNSSSNQEILIAYGEHLRNNNQVLRTFSSNDFSFEFKAKKGKNIFLNPLKRIAGRYLQIFAKEPIDITFIGVRPVTYQKTLIKHQYDDPLVNQINEICLSTLDCCQHEHYEDCPWREQSLYTLDMRNQMLCGYSLYEGFEYQRHNILLTAKGLNQSGFISLCVPSNIDLPIPSFSLHYILAVNDYLKHTGDYSIIPYVEKPIKTIMKTILSQVDSTGLIHYFPKPYWNFYEWTKGSHNNDDIPKHTPVKDQYDLIINALLVYVIPIYNQIFNENIDVEDKKRAIIKHFYSKDKGVFVLSTKTKEYSQLGNILAYSIGLGNDNLLEKIISDPNMITISLSMKGFLYEPLLKAGKRYQDYIIADIKKVYGAMLDDGATSCYEAAFNISGLGIDVSLCHGWSALPAYYFAKLLDK